MPVVWNPAVSRFAQTRQAQSSEGEPNMTRQTIILTFAAVLGAAQLACGGAAVPHQEMATAQAGVRAAEVGGAAEHPQAELRLKHANEKIAAAEALIKEGDNETATLRLREAESDAELALSIALQEQAKKDAEQALKRIKILMQETQS